MPTSKREEVLAAFFARLGTIPGAGLIARMPTYRLDYTKLPALIQIDGGEHRIDAMSGALTMMTDIGVVVIVRTATDADLGTLLTDWNAKVRAALGADPYLSGKVLSLLYSGCNEPVPLSEAEDDLPTIAQTMTFEATRIESETDPYSL
ncbi:MAG: hypothetical protein K0R61_1183 [Microvirga sp.]|nr:hypothetical protein [Microvirga sp.]MDF2970733.1 hypothetical protein [Microvirga sp.]